MRLRFNTFHLALLLALIGAFLIYQWGYKRSRSPLNSHFVKSSRPAGPAYNEPPVYDTLSVSSTHDALPGIGYFQDTVKRRLLIQYFGAVIGNNDTIWVKPHDTAGLYGAKIFWPTPANPGPNLLIQADD